MEVNLPFFSIMNDHIALLIILDIQPMDSTCILSTKPQSHCNICLVNLHSKLQALAWSTQMQIRCMIAKTHYVEYR